MRAIVIGAGLGGLACALRLQRVGIDVTVLEQSEAPGGRAGQIVDSGFTWDTGPSLITMPWVLEETFAAGGMDLAREIELRRLDPLYRIRWANDEQPFEFHDSVQRLTEQVAMRSPRDARRVPDFLDALAPIYEHGILGAGRRPMHDLRSLTATLPTLTRLRAVGPLYRFVARYFDNERVREAFSFHSLFIGGDPFRVPAIYGALVYLQVLDGGWYSMGGVHAIVRAMARPLDIRFGARVQRIETSGGAVRAAVLDGGERLAADVVISNADVLTTHALLGRGRGRRALTPTMSCFLLYLGLSRPEPALRHHTLLVGPGYRDFITSVTRDRTLPSTLSTYVHAPARTEPAMARDGGDSLAVLLPVPNLSAEIDWETAADQVRDAILTDLETAHGLDGLRGSIVVEHRRTPEDFRTDFGAVLGNAFSIEPTLHQSAWLRPPNRSTAAAGLYHVGAGTHPGAGIPGVLLGAAITAALVADDAGVRTAPWT